MSGLEETPVTKMTKKEWRKPEVRRISAGSAEAAPGVDNDGTPGGSIHS